MLDISRLQNDSGNSFYWNGKGWQTAGKAYNATLSTRVSGSVTWSGPSTVALLSGANLLEGRYLIRAFAYDSASVYTIATIYCYIGTDSVSPVASFTTPAANEVVTSLALPTGTVTDAGGRWVAELAFPVLFGRALQV